MTTRAPGSVPEGTVGLALPPEATEAQLLEIQEIAKGMDRTTIPLRLPSGITPIWRAYTRSLPMSRQEAILLKRFLKKL